MTFRCKCNKGDENKISVLQAQPTQLCIMNEFHWRAGMIHRPLSPWSNTEGDNYILQPPSINLHNLHTWLSKQMPSIPEGCASRGTLSVRCNSGPAEGPRKILKYRSNLRLHPVNFSNKLCILFFITL